MGKALVVYCTRAGGTKKIGELIAEGIRIEGGEADVVNVTGVKKEADLDGPTLKGRLVVHSAHLDGAVKRLVVYLTPWTISSRWIWSVGR